MIREEAVVETWLDAGEKVVAATLVSSVGSSSHPLGATFFVSRSGRVAGAVSGGCIEAALFAEADKVFASNHPMLVTYGPADESPFGLTCGGTIEVLVAPLDERMYRAVLTMRESNEPSVVVTRLHEPFETIVVSASGIDGASFGHVDLFDAVRSVASALLDGGETSLRSFGSQGEPIGDAERCFFHVFADAPVMYIVGAVDFTRPLSAVAKVLNYHVVVIDPREVFATAERIPEADEIVVAWPDDELARRRIDSRTAIVILTHDSKFDIPVLRLAVNTSAGYIGVMGSRATHQRRLDTLRELGLSDDELERISAPIGLDIGARVPEETAIAIVAEIIAQRNGRDGGRLRLGKGNLRGRPLEHAH